MTKQDLIAAILRAEGMTQRTTQGKTYASHLARYSVEQLREMLAELEGEGIPTHAGVVASPKKRRSGRKSKKGAAKSRKTKKSGKGRRSGPRRSKKTGRFIKSGGRKSKKSKKSRKGRRSAQRRSKKTGRFIKSGGRKSKKSKKSKKSRKSRRSMPRRDKRTGRFLKSRKSRGKSRRSRKSRRSPRRSRRLSARIRRSGGRVTQTAGRVLKGQKERAAKLVRGISLGRIPVREGWSKPSDVPAATAKERYALFNLAYEGVRVPTARSRKLKTRRSRPARVRSQVVPQSQRVVAQRQLVYGGPPVVAQQGPSYFGGGFPDLSGSMSRRRRYMRSSRRHSRR